MGVAAYRIKYAAWGDRVPIASVTAQAITNKAGSAGSDCSLPRAFPLSAGKRPGNSLREVGEILVSG
jgi:hypothetical protein